MKTVRAILIPLAALILFWLAMPGVSFVPYGHLASDKSRAAHYTRWGEPWTSLNVAAGHLQRIRMPIAKRIGGFQPIFRISQSWHLYRDGPSTIRRMEIWVDDELRYRTEDNQYDWRESTFRNRRIRPMAETMVSIPKARNRLGLGRAIVTAARDDFPNAQSVEIRSTWARRGKPATVHHYMTAHAPDWNLEDHK